MEEINALSLAIGHLYLAREPKEYSLRDLAKIFGISHISIRNKLLALKNIDFSLYCDVVDEMERRQPESLKKEHVQKRVLKAISLFLKGDMTVIQIAETLDTTEFVIYRDLTVRAPQINDYLTDIKIEENILIEITEILAKHSKDNLVKK